MAINIANILSTLQNTFASEISADPITDKEFVIADEIAVLLRQIAINPSLPPWVESTIFLDYDPDLPDFEEMYDDDDDEEESFENRVEFDYKKNCVQYWRNPGGTKRRSLSSVQTKFKKLKRYTDKKWTRRWFFGVNKYRLCIVLQSGRVECFLRVYPPILL